MANNNEYPNQVPSAKEERLMPKFYQRDGTVGEIVVKGPLGCPVKATSGSNTLFPREGGRLGRINMPERFKR